MSTDLGWNTASNPTSASGGKEKSVAKVVGSEPWNTGKDAAYEYHPYGDTSADKKDAPSPLYVSIIPNVNLPKVCFFICLVIQHKLNLCRSYMIHLTSMAKMVSHKGRTTPFICQYHHRIHVSNPFASRRSCLNLMVRFMILGGFDYFSSFDT